MTSEILQEIEALEKTLVHLIKPTMTLDEKIKALEDSYWRAHHTGYCDSMANRLMAGIEDSMTECWEKDCRHKYEVSRLLRLLKEQKQVL